MVEFAVIMPLFMLLIFGTIEVGWFFSQQVEVRNAAREGARLAVVDYADADSMRDQVCGRAPLSEDRASVRFELIAVSPTATEPDTARVTVRQEYESIVGGIVPGFGGSVIESTVEMRLEQEIGNWTTDAAFVSCAAP